MRYPFLPLSSLQWQKPLIDHPKKGIGQIRVHLKGDSDIHLSRCALDLQIKVFLFKEMATHYLMIKSCLIIKWSCRAQQYYFRGMHHCNLAASHIDARLWCKNGSVIPGWHLWVFWASLPFCLIQTLSSLLQGCKWRSWCAQSSCSFLTVLPCGCWAVHSCDQRSSGPELKLPEFAGSCM